MMIRYNTRQSIDFPNKPAEQGWQPPRWHRLMRGETFFVETKRRERRFRRREMVRIAWRDLAAWADLAETLADLSASATACVDCDRHA